MKYLAAALAALLAGCAPMQWVKEDSTPEQLDQDALQCQQDAFREARTQAWLYRPFTPFIGRDALGRPFIFSPGYYDPFYDPFMEEARLAQFCMRSKGYRLEAADKPKPATEYMQRDDKK